MNYIYFNDVYLKSENAPLNTFRYLKYFIRAPKGVETLSVSQNGTGEPPASLPLPTLHCLCPNPLPPPKPISSPYPLPVPYLSHLHRMPYLHTDELKRKGICVREKKEEQRRDMQAADEKKGKRALSERKLPLKPPSLFLSLYPPSTPLPRPPPSSQSCRCPLGHTFQISRKGPIDAKYQRERDEQGE